MEDRRDRGMGCRGETKEEVEARSEPFGESFILIVWSNSSLLVSFIFAPMLGVESSSQGAEVLALFYTVLESLKSLLAGSVLLLRASI